jgi:hypothetical protein
VFVIVYFFLNKMQKRALDGARFVLAVANTKAVH